MIVYNSIQLRLFQLLEQIHHGEYQLGLPGIRLNNNENIEQELKLAINGVFPYSIVYCNFEKELVPNINTKKNYIIYKAFILKSFLDFVKGKDINDISYRKLTREQLSNFKNTPLQLITIKIEEKKDLYFIFNYMYNK